MEDFSYLSDDNQTTSPASDFLEVKPKIITRNENQFMVLLTSKGLNLTTDVSNNQ